MTEHLSGRLAELIDMTNDGAGNVRLAYNIPTRGLIGFRSAFLRETRGTGVANWVFTEFWPMAGEIRSAINGVLVASEAGTAITYGLLNAQGRGETFVEPGTPVYEGMVIGLHPKQQDIIVNVCKEKKLTNMRSSNAEIAKRLSPPVKLSLEDRGVTGLHSRRRAGGGYASEYSAAGESAAHPRQTSGTKRGVGAC